MMKFLCAMLRQMPTPPQTHWNTRLHALLPNARQRQLQICRTKKRAQVVEQDSQKPKARAGSRVYHNIAVENAHQLLHKHTAALVGKWDDVALTDVQGGWLGRLLPVIRVLGF